MSSSPSPSLGTIDIWSHMVLFWMREGCSVQYRVLIGISGLHQKADIGPLVMTTKTIYLCSRCPPRRQNCPSLRALELSNPVFLCQGTSSKVLEHTTAVSGAFQEHQLHVTLQTHSVIILTIALATLFLIVTMAPCSLTGAYVLVSSQSNFYHAKICEALLYNIHLTYVAI